MIRQPTRQTHRAPSAFGAGVLIDDRVRVRRRDLELLAVRSSAGPGPTDAAFSSYATWKLNSTSSAVIGWPSENAAPFRRWNVHVRPSGATSQDLASTGSNCCVPLSISHQRREQSDS